MQRQRTGHLGRMPSTWWDGETPRSRTWWCAQLARESHHTKDVWPNFTRQGRGSIERDSGGNHHGRLGVTAHDRRSMLWVNPASGNTAGCIGRLLSRTLFSCQSALLPAVSICALIQVPMQVQLWPMLPLRLNTRSLLTCSG